VSEPRTTSSSPAGFVNPSILDDLTKQIARCPVASCGMLGYCVDPRACEAGIEEPSFIVRFADQDEADETFSGYGAEEAARKYFKAKRTACVSLFREIARG
jgi:hypothetical protein